MIFKHFYKQKCLFCSLLFPVIWTMLLSLAESHNDYCIITSGFFIKWYIRHSLWEIKSHVSVNIVMTPQRPKWYEQRKGLGLLTKEKKCLAVCFHNFKKKRQEKRKANTFLFGCLLYSSFSILVAEKLLLGPLGRPLTKGAQNTFKDIAHLNLQRIN